MHAHTLGCPTQERRPPGVFHFWLGNSDKHSLLAVTGWGGIKRWPPVSGITWCQFEEVGLFWQQSLATNNKLFLWKTSKKVAWLHKTRDIDHITVVVLFCLFEFAYFIMIYVYYFTSIWWYLRLQSPDLTLEAVPGFVTWWRPPSSWDSETRNAGGRFRWRIRWTCSCPKDLPSIRWWIFVDLLKLKVDLYHIIYIYIRTHNIDISIEIYCAFP